VAIGTSPRRAVEREEERGRRLEGGGARRADGGLGEPAPAAAGRLRNVDRSRFAIGELDRLRDPRAVRLGRLEPVEQNGELELRGSRGGELVDADDVAREEPTIRENARRLLFPGSGQNQGS